MNGGVSSRIGGTSEGTVMIFRATIKSPQASYTRHREHAQQLVRRRVILFEILENLLRRSIRIDFRGDLAESLLIGAKIVVSDFEQPVERDVDHFLERELLRVILRAQAEVAMGAREQVIAKILLVIL
jgi:hypothetical protein